MLKKVEDLITKYNMINAGDTVTVGVSGGADSVCLLLNLISYTRVVPFSIKVVHINHLIRQEASEDAAFVEDLCRKFDLPFFLYEEPVEQIAKEEGISTEEAGRKMRYLRFSEISNGGKVAVAHNSNDVAETVLFNIFRGTGLEGLASLEPVNGSIIRPLLGVTRQEIEEYLCLMDQTYVTDKTNLMDTYSRNRIRNNILPYAEENIVKGSTAHVAALSEKMRAVRHFIEKQARDSYGKCVECQPDARIISIGSLFEMDELIQNEVILLALEELTSGRKDIGEKHIDAIFSIINKSGEKKVDLPYNLEAVKQYDTLIIRRKNMAEKVDLQVSIRGEGEYDLGNAGMLKVKIFPYDDSQLISQNTYTKWFDYDKIINCLEVRNRLSKDYLTVNNQLATKTLKDYMIDEKIPKEMRDKIPVVADGSHILWIIGYRISEAYKITDKTKTVIELEYIEKGE